MAVADALRTANLTRICLLYTSGVVVVRVILKFDLVRCGSRAETCARVCKSDPAACNNLVLGGSRLELDYIVILSTAADPVDRTGLVLGDCLLYTSRCV